MHDKPPPKQKPLTEIELLEQQIERIKKRDEARVNWQERVRALDSFAIGDKARTFDALYEQADLYMRAVARGDPEPPKGYIFETVMGECLGHDVWAVINTMIL